MGISDIWWLDLWGFFIFVGAFFAVFVILIGMLGVAIEGRKGWGDTGWIALVMFVGLALGPLWLLALPAVAVYRAVRNV